MQYIHLFLLSFAVSLSSVNAETNVCENIVHVRFFHMHCKECHKAQKVMNELKYHFGNKIQIHTYNYLIPSNYSLLATLENELGVIKNAPVAVYVGSNSFYGLSRIKTKIYQCISNKLYSGGTSLWIPLNINSNRCNAVTLRFKSFSPYIILLSGFIDGVNPCAFATLILFLSLLGCYKHTYKEILYYTFTFVGAVFITYVFIGIGLIKLVGFISKYNIYYNVFQFLLASLCVILAVSQLIAAYRNKLDNKITNSPFALSLYLRKRIATFLGRSIRHSSGLIIMFAVGVCVSLIETICTGQVYLPTLIYMINTHSSTYISILYIILYNIMFILPILIIGSIVAFWKKSVNIFEWQVKFDIYIRIALFLLFAFFAIFIIYNLMTT